MAEIAWKESAPGARPELGRSPRPLGEEPEWNLLCPECGGVAFVAGVFLHCPAEGRRYPTLDGVLPLLSRSRRRQLAPFLAAYRIVRRAEGWGGEASYYLDLPFRDRTGRHRAIWKLRARSFRAALREIGSAFGAAPLQVLDLGAGNCWFAARLARLGHRVLAIDVHLDDQDGLRAFDRYRHRLPHSCGLVQRAQADLEALALGSGQFDVVVANGSLHYAAELSRPVREAYRLLRAGGLFLVLDSPTYSTRESGWAMVAERTREHRERYGFLLGPRLQSGFVVFSELAGLLAEVGFSLRVVRPFPGCSRALGGLLARALGGRPLAEFPVFAARKGDATAPS